MAAVVGRVEGGKIVPDADVLLTEGTTVTVRGLDAIDGTPVLDLNPYLTGFAARGEVREAQWAQEIMSAYW